MIPTLAGSGAEALALVREQARFDIAVIDMQMPGMSGLTLARQLRKLAAELPIVMTSALGMPMYAAGDNRPLQDLPIVISPVSGANEQHEAMRQLGVKSIVFKPVKPSMLRATLLQHFDTAPNDIGSPDQPRQSGECLDGDMDLCHPLRILIAEDNLTNQKVALRMLNRLGYEADVAFNGLEAVTAVHEQIYDVILMDVQMPEMDGLCASKAIRESSKVKEQPYIIALTASVSKSDREQCLGAGMNSFLSKPIRVDDLVRVLRAAPRLSAEE